MVDKNYVMAKRNGLERAASDSCGGFMVMVNALLIGWYATLGG